MADSDPAQCVDGTYVTKGQCEAYRDELKKVVIDGNEKLCGTIMVHDQQAKKILDTQINLNQNFSLIQESQLKTEEHLTQVAANQAIAVNTQQQLAQVTQQNSQIIQWMQGVISSQNKRTADALWRTLLIVTTLSTGILYLYQAGAIS